jgi:hypothetical protein
MAAVGIIIHVSVGKDKRTEYFSDERIRIGSDEHNDLQIHTETSEAQDVWLELELTEGVYRVINFKESLNFQLNGKPLRRFVAVKDGDMLEIPANEISFGFFLLASKSSLITTNRETHVAQFIEQAAIGSAASPKRDDAKAFLREFVRELSREIRWSTKLIVLVVAIGFIFGILYLGFAFNRQLRENREQADRQNEIIRKMEEQLGLASNQLGELDKSNKDIIKTVSLAPNLRVEYGNGVCLIVGVYDLVDRRNGKTLRYPDPQSVQPDPYEPTTQTEDGAQTSPPQIGLTTEGNGTPFEYDFIGTGFHVGGGYIMTNRHVLQPWEEDDFVKQMIKEYGARARVKRLVVYFPNFPQPFPLKLKQVGAKEDLAVATIDMNLLSPEIPVLPLENENSDAISIGRTVVSMGYPNGPDRLLAMVDDAEARSINARCSGSRQCIITFLSQNRKIVPLTTQGAITDLDARRVVHDAKTAEGGSGAPLFGQTGKVIGVNFGVFTESNAANMAVPVKYAIELLKKAGWKSPEELQQEQNTSTTANTETNTSVVKNN